MSTRALQLNLTQIILRDLRAHLQVVIVTLLCVVSSFAVIYSSHLNRSLNATLEVMVAEQDALGIEWRHLLLEENALAEHSRIEHLATRKLGMSRPRPDQEVMVVLP